MLQFFLPSLLLNAQEDLDKNYILSAGDTISVQVFGQSDLNSEQEISNQGFINIGLIGSIEVARMAVSEAEEAIRKAFIEKLMLRDPQVIIGVRQYSDKLVSVLGQVNQPGSIKFPKDVNQLPIVRVISMVGDFRNIAKKDAVSVVRKDANGNEQIFIVDLSDIGKKRKSRKDDLDFLIYPDDVIYVPERLF